MLGAIIGDIVGSIYEWDNHRNKDFLFFAKNGFFTDDSVMTLAVAEALTICHQKREVLAKEVVSCMQYWGNRYPDRGYGGRFTSWLLSAKPQPYQSYGNGAGMRIAPVAYVGQSLVEVKQLSQMVTGVTHNHPEGYLAAEAIAVCTYFARKGKSKTFIRNYVINHYYPLTLTLDEIRPDNIFSEKASVATPQAIQAFFEADDFEDAIRNAISIGGDSDTIAAMTGAIAEAYFGIPETLRVNGLSYLTPALRHVYRQFQKTFIRDETTTKSTKVK